MYRFRGLCAPVWELDKLPERAHGAWSCGSQWLGLAFTSRSLLHELEHRKPCVHLPIILHGQRLLCWGLLSFPHSYELLSCEVRAVRRGVPWRWHQCASGESLWARCAVEGNLVKWCIGMLASWARVSKDSAWHSCGAGSAHPSCARPGTEQVRPS